MIILDTNILIRFFTNDDPKLSPKAKSLLESDEIFFIPEIVFAELQFVLAKKYNVNRDEITSIFDFLVTRANFKITDKTRYAISLFKTCTLSIVDCFVAAYAQNETIATFDQKLQKISKTKSYFKR